MILEGYGLTETTAPATVNLTTRFKIGTAGPALPGVGLKIADDGEIWVKGIDVFAGYWNNPKATAEVIRRRVVQDRRHRRSSTTRATSRSPAARRRSSSPRAARTSPPPLLEDPIRANPIVGQVVVVGDQQAVHLGARSPSTPRCCRSG